MIKEHLNLLVFILFVLIGVVFINNITLTERVTSKVLESLKREYTPGPYSPGFDPDKVPQKP